MTDTSPMTKGDRDSLIRIVKARARQAEREVDARKAILIAEVFNEATAEYEARDALWADAVAIAEECAAKANAQIQARCADLGIPSRHAPGVTLGWRPRGWSSSTPAAAQSCSNSPRSGPTAWPRTRKPRFTTPPSTTKSG